MAVTPAVSTGFKLEIDPAGTTTFQTIFAHVDFDTRQSKPRQETTKQLTTASAIGIREHKVGLTERTLSFSLRWDAADTQTGLTHHELWALFIERAKPNWKITYPPTGGTGVTPTYTNARRRTFRGVFRSLRIRGTLGTIVTADVELQICGAVTEATS
jgi:hypothetical protein